MHQTEEVLEKISTKILGVQKFLCLPGSHINQIHKYVLLLVLLQGNTEKVIRNQTEAEGKANDKGKVLLAKHISGRWQKAREKE